ncbi:protein kinase [Clostridium pasteurianum]|nr:protein kinase [Clostridium pasteurianum DSM 525 = ATCC 6013]AOZ81173.1 protein kinase [Clostridium pasteurianum]OMH22094.1 protein kinase [Clostridium pasteurianum]
MYKKYIEHFNTNLLQCMVLGRGHNGVVYLLPDGKVIKVCFSEESCRGEYYILNKVNGNKYFPKVYGMNGNYMIRDYVGGICLRDYVKEYGFDRELALKVVSLLEEFDKLKFTKRDIRCKDIFVQPDGTLKVIDPKKCYSKERDFPRHLSKGFEKLGILDYFMEVVKEKRPKLYRRWFRKIREYIREISEEDD